MVTRRFVGAADRRLGAASAARAALRYVFPDHWSFLLGEIATYCFAILIITGVYLTFFFVASTEPTIYTGPYAPLAGREVSEAYASTLRISFEVRAGLLVRQVHHWAALVFVAAITLHTLRILLTGSFRRPRELNHLVGVALLGIVVLEGFAGYSLADDLLSGMGLAIGYGVAASIPLVGGKLAPFVWDGPFPGGDAFAGRLYAVHILLLPVVIATLIAVHLALLVRQRHSQFPGPGRSERNVVGSPLWPAYALRSMGLFAGTAAALVLLGGLVQINPIWQWGPFEVADSTNGAQPDWYLGWLIGALRLWPAWEPSVGGVTLWGEPFPPGIIFPTLVFGVLAAWPFLERIATGDRARHDLDDRPRDHPTRTALVAALLTAVTITFLAGAADRAFYGLDLSYATLVLVSRIAVVAGPILVFVVVRRLCVELARGELHPLDGFTGTTVARGAGGRIVEEPRSATPSPSPDRLGDRASETSDVS